MIEFGTLTRATGKVFVGIRATVPQDGHITANSQCSKGGEAPAIVVAKNAAAGEFILIIASLACDQSVEVSVFDKDGAVVEAQSKKIGHLQSAFTSKYNTFRKVHGLEEIRKFDENGIIDEAFVRVDRMSVFGDGSELVHAFIAVPCVNDSNANAKMTVRILDRQGQEVPVSKLSVLKDKVEPVMEGSDYSVRFIELSARYAQALPFLALWVDFESEELPVGFVCLEKEQLDAMRGHHFGLHDLCASGPRYDEWFTKVHRASKYALEAQHSAKFDIEPLFSFIVPLYHTPVDSLERMILSVLDQTYGKLELILVNASPEDADLRAVIEKHAARDERVRIVPLEQDADFALATEEGVKIDQGDFLCFLDQGDFIEPDLLHCYASAINKHSETDLLYCDEDMYRDGHFFDGFLKPDFDWELLAAMNYVRHLLAVRTSLIEQIAFPASNVAGAQDWDIAFKAAEKARNIFHVRKVLYHCCALDGLMDTAQEAGAKAVQGHFDRIGIPATVVDGPIPNTHAVDYKLPDELPLVSIVIPTKDYVDLLGRCVESIYDKSSYKNFEIIVVENNSEKDETFDYYKKLEGEHDNLKVIRFGGNFNFSAICNYGARQAQGAYLLFLNNDTEVITPNWIERLMGPMMRDDVACTGAKLLYPDDTIQHAGVIIPKSPPGHVALHFQRDDLFYRGILQHPHELSAVTAACMLVKKDVFDAIDGFDEEFEVTYNDVDLCLRLIEAGKRVVIEPRAELYHYESASRGADTADVQARARFTKEQGMFMARWSRYIGEGDPMYGINYAVASGYYDLDWASSPWGV